MKKNRKFIILLLAVIVIFSVVFLVVFKKKREDFTGKVKVDLFASYSDLGIINLNEENLLQFRDAASGEKIVLCDKPNCKHDNNECNALFKDYYVHLSAIYNDKLYIVMQGEDFNSILYEADVNGSNRKEILSLGKVDFSSKSLFLDNYLLMEYRIGYDLENVDSGEMRKLEKPISGLAIINIKKQEVDYIPEKVEYDGGITKIHMYEDKVYYEYVFMDVEYDFMDHENIDFDYLADHTFHRIYSYDVKTGTESIVYEGQDIFVEEFNENYAFLTKTKENENIYALNLSNQKEELIIEENLYDYCCVDGERIVYLGYPQNDAEAVEAEEDLYSHFYYYDMVSKESYYIGSSNRNKIDTIEMFLGDYAYLYYLLTDGEEMNEIGDGCITKDDFYKGNFDKVIRFD